MSTKLITVVSINTFYSFSYVIVTAIAHNIILKCYLQLYSWKINKKTAETTIFLLDFFSQYLYVFIGLPLEQIKIYS